MKKKVLSLFISFALFTGLFFACPIPAQADLSHYPVPYAKELKVLVDQEYGYAMDLGSRIKDTDKVTIKVTNKSVTRKAYVEENAFYFYARKAGTSKVTLKVKNKKGDIRKYNFTVTAKKETLPFKSIKIGTTSLKKKFQKQSYIEIKPAKKNMKISITPSKDWKIKSIEYDCYYYGDDKSVKDVNKKVKNNSTLKFHKSEDYSEQVTIEMVYKYNKGITRSFNFNTDN